MVRSKETFEQWSTKKKLRNPPSPRETEGTRRTMRANTESGDIQRQKGMKRTLVNPNPVPLPLGDEETTWSPVDREVNAAGRRISSTVFNHRQEEGSGKKIISDREEVPPSIDIDNGRHDFSKRHMKERAEPLEKQGLLHDRRLHSMNEGEQFDHRDRSKTKKIRRRSMSKEIEIFNETEERGCFGSSSRMRSYSSSSASMEQSKSGRQELNVVNTHPHRNQQSSSIEERSREREYKEQSSRADCRRTSMTRDDVRKGRLLGSEPRHSRRSHSSESGSGRWRRSRQYAHVSQEQECRHNGNSENNSARFDQSPVVRIEEGANQSEDSSPRRSKHADDSANSASMEGTEIEDHSNVEVKSETASRKDRRDRQKIREKGVRRREKQGMKAYYLQVNHNGKPYADGSTAWRTDLNKLARGLDPSVMDVREQPPTEMSTLRRRLRQNFDYSHLGEVT